MPSHAEIIRKANQILLVDRDSDAVDDFFATDYVAHGTEAEIRGLSGVRRFLRTLFDAFEELEVSVEALVEAGDRVAWQRRCSGTQTGAFMGFPASERDIVWRDMIVSRVEDGRIAEEWVVTDMAERLLRARKGSKG